MLVNECHLLWMEKNEWVKCSLLLFLILFFWVQGRERDCIQPNKRSGRPDPVQRLILEVPDTLLCFFKKFTFLGLKWKIFNVFVQCRRRWKPHNCNNSAQWVRLWFWTFFVFFFLQNLHWRSRYIQTILSGSNKIYWSILTPTWRVTPSGGGNNTRLRLFSTRLWLEQKASESSPIPVGWLDSFSFRYLFSTRKYTNK